VSPGDGIGVTAVGGLDSQTKNSNGAAIYNNGGTLTIALQSADSTSAGIVTAGVQTLAGAKTFTGIGSSCNLTALDIVFKTCGFFRNEDAIIPPVTVGSHDGYSDKLEQSPGLFGPSRYAARYYKSNNKVKSLLDTVIENKSTDAENFYQVPKVKESAKVWEFDNSVAERFQQEARDHIPDYSRVIDQCIQLAKDNLKPDDAIIDIGSALGYTVDQFIKAGFTNMWGLDNSEAMYAKTLHQDRIVLANELPKQKYKMILINWTFHFIVDKAEYLTTMYDRLEPGGYLILSDKTTQSAEVKKMYYDFKRANGVAESYIQEKEKKLAGRSEEHTSELQSHLT
jgi:SAM-dependent methyltransferase